MLRLLGRHQKGRTILDFNKARYDENNNNNNKMRSLKNSKGN